MAKRLRLWWMVRSSVGVMPDQLRPGDVLLQSDDGPWGATWSVPLVTAEQLEDGRWRLGFGRTGVTVEDRPLRARKQGLGDWLWGDDRE